MVMCVGYTLLFGRLFPHGRASYCNRQRLYAKIGCKGTTFFSVSQVPIQFAFIFAPPCLFSRRSYTTSTPTIATANGYIVNTSKAAELTSHEQWGILIWALRLGNRLTSRIHITYGIYASLPKILLYFPKIISRCIHSNPPNRSRYLRHGNHIRSVAV